MIDTNALRAEIVRNGYTQGDIAKKLGLSARTFSTRMRKGVFDSDEMYSMIQILNIKNPAQIFLTNTANQ